MSADPSTDTGPILEAEHLTVRFPMPKTSLFAPRQYLEAVRDVSFSLPRGTTLGLVGESGSGKTTTAMAAIRLTGPATGAVRFEGTDLFQLDDEAMRTRRRDMQVIFQDPYSSLNPRDRVNHIVREPLDLLGGADTDQEKDDRVSELFGLVGLRPRSVEPFPAPVLWRAAPADFHRARAGHPPQADRLRRARLGAGCRHPGADPEPAGASAGPVWVNRTCSSLTTWASCGRSATRSRSCILGASSSRPPAPSCSPGRAIPTRRRCWMQHLR